MTSSEMSPALLEIQRHLAPWRLNVMNDLLAKTCRKNREMCQGIHRLMNRVRHNQGRLVINRVKLAEAEWGWIINRGEYQHGPARRLREIIWQLELWIEDDLAGAEYLDGAWKDSMEVEVDLRRRISYVALDI